MRAPSPPLSVASTSNLDEFSADFAGFDLADCLKDIPPHLAPVVAMPKPQETDLRTPRRTASAGKLGVKQMAEGDQVIIRAALKRLDALIITHDPFPTKENFRILAAMANHWACNKFQRGYLKLAPESTYEQVVSQSITR